MSEHKPLKSPFRVVHHTKFGFHCLPAPNDCGYYVGDISVHTIERGPFPKRADAVRELKRLEYVRGFDIKGSVDREAERDAAINAALKLEGMGPIASRIVRKVEPRERGSRREVRVWASSPQGLALVGVVVHVDEGGVRAELSRELSAAYWQEYVEDREEQEVAWKRRGGRSR